MSRSENTTQERSNNFNLLRLLFAWLVIVAHCPEIADGDKHREPLTNIFHTITFGELAVDAFFLISGFLIVKSWRLDPRPLAFLRKRALRIYPAFIVAALLCAFVLPLFSKGFEYLSTIDYPAYFTWLPVFRLKLPPVFEQIGYEIVNGSIWTLKYEFLCYLLVAAFGVTIGFQRETPWLLATAFTTVAFIALRLGMSSPLQSDFLDLWFRLSMCFFAGGTFYLVKDRIVYSPRWLVIAIPLLVAGMFIPRFCEVFVAYAGAYVLFYFALTPMRTLIWFNRLPDISYGVYLYAWPMACLLVLHQPQMPLVWLMLLTTALSVLAGLISWYAIEAPCMRLKPRRT